MQALLSLGASPDYKDRRGLTPLYHTVLTGGETSCCETLLYHHAKLGIRDENGWDETHQVRVCVCVCPSGCMESCQRHFRELPSTLCDDVLCVLVQESSSTSEPTHAMTCCTSHVLSWTHFTRLPPHPASPASHSCCVEEIEAKASVWLV